jgi:hypothetical protein
MAKELEAKIYEVTGAGQNEGTVAEIPASAETADAPEEKAA